MPAQILDGRRVAEQVTAEVRTAVARRVAAGKPAPGLAVVQVGEHAASSIYVRNKRWKPSTDSVVDDIADAQLPEERPRVIDPSGPASWPERSVDPASAP